MRFSQVTDKALGDSELFSAEVTDEGTFSGVNAHVPDVGVGGVETLAADFADVVDAAVYDCFCGVYGVLVDFRVFATFLEEIDVYFQ